LAGRILLKVEDHGQAYYIDPVSLRLSYLGRPDDAFQTIRQYGLGITNTDLAKIPIAESSAKQITASTITPISSSLINDENKRYAFKYNNVEHEIIQAVSVSLYNIYKNSPKVYSYNPDNPPLSIRNNFYGMFLRLKLGDTSIDEIIAKLKLVAARNNWTEDETLEFVLSFIQYIPYDQTKADSGNNIAFYPYETIYLNKGVCADKTFLAVVFLRRLGYGSAILDFPEINHTALGVSCSLEYSINSSGYCYVETTNYFPFGVIPQNINGQAQIDSDKFDSIFDASRLGKMEIYQESSGKTFQRIAEIRSRVQTIRDLKADLSARQAEINNLNIALENKEAELNLIKTQLGIYLSNGQTSQYNALVPVYNSGTAEYNSNLNIYISKINKYNQKAAEFNSLIKSFYQS